LQKIEEPEYAEALRPSPVDGEIVAFYATLVLKAVLAQRRGRASEVKHIQDILSSLPLQPFSVLQNALRGMTGGQAGYHNIEAELRPILEPVLARQPFDPKWYLAAYPDVAKAAGGDSNVSSHEHFIRHGYFEDRAPGAPTRFSADVSP
jgi:hypothetical protein